MQRFLIILFLCCSFCVQAQSIDSIALIDEDSFTTTLNDRIIKHDLSKVTVQEIEEDSLKAVPVVWMTPKKVALFSGILPGLGQVYNGQYWKVPIIYAGFGIAGYLIADNLKDYNAFRQVYAGRVSGDLSVNLKYPQYADYSDDVIKNARDYSRKNLDITVLVTALVYGLQIVDALVYAQLKNFDISPDISFRPKAVSFPMGGVGIGLVMNF